MRIFSSIAEKILFVFLLLLTLIVLSFLSIDKAAAQPVVILKADDLGDPAETNWNRFFNYIANQNIYASVGIVTTFVANNPNTIATIKNLNGTGRFEFWNHGYDHSSTMWQEDMGLAQPSASDYDGDGITDLSIKTDDGRWLIDYASNGFGWWDATFFGYGDRTSHPVPANYDNDGKADLSIKADDGRWMIDYSGNGFGLWDATFIGYGDSTAHPVPSDYDGDGIADLSVKADDGGWMIDYASNGFGVWDVILHGYGDNTAHAVPADYDGDRKSDMSVKADDGRWLIDYASNGFGSWDAVFIGYGNSTAHPIPAKYDSDAKVDLSVKTDDGRWLIDYSSNGFGLWDAEFIGYGDSTARPVPANYDSDGKIDLSVVTGDSRWLIDYSNNGFGSWDHIPLYQKTEFWNSGYNFQLSHLQSSQAFFSNTLGIISHSFGAPFNKSDSDTKLALSTFTDVKVWMCYQPTEPQVSNEKLILDVTIVEDGQLQFHADPIINNWANDYQHRPYIVIQMHPNSWRGEASWSELDRLISFLKTKNVTFMLPYQYYLSRPIT